MVRKSLLHHFEYEYVVPNTIKGLGRVQQDTNGICRVVNLKIDFFRYADQLSDCIKTSSKTKLMIWKEFCPSIRHGRACELHAQTLYLM